MGPSTDRRWQPAAVMAGVLVAGLTVVATGLGSRIDDTQELVAQGWDRHDQLRQSMQENRDQGFKIDGKLDSIKVQIKQLVKSVDELKKELKGRDR